MTLRLFDSISDRKEDFVPLVPGKVGIYVCGPTVYDMSHLGHARCYVAWDAVVRHLKWRGYDVYYARNYTDVDDKILRRAAERGEPPLELARRFADEYLADMDALGCGRPDVEPRVSGTIPEIIALIGQIIERGHAYESMGDVYFAVRSFPGYGKLSKRNLDDLMSGARVEPGEQKRDPLDFALWKAKKPGEALSWESPWGPGRPGWHIECSAMSKRHLGVTFDIHAGGKDLVFPHHENEIAQSEAGNGAPYVKYWMHNGFVNFDGEKMSKSLGNFSTIRDVLGQVDGEGLRFFLLSTHYRAPINFTPASVFEGENRVEYVYETLAKLDARLAGQPAETETLDARREASLLEGVGAAMDDDFNTAEALGHLSPFLTWANELVDKAPAGASKKAVRGTLQRLRADLRVVGKVLGIGEQDPAVFLRRLRDRKAARKGVDGPKVEGLLVERATVRKNKDFARADAIRVELAAMGVEIMDTPAGTTWRIT